MRSFNLDRPHDFGRLDSNDFEKTALGFLGINSQHVRSLSVEPDAQLGGLPNVKLLTARASLDAVVVLVGDTIRFEHYANGVTPNTFHATQSAAKPILNLLVGKAVADGMLDLSANVESYLPEIGTGFKGRSVADVLAMNVIHEGNRATLDDAEDGAGRELFDESETSYGVLSAMPAETSPRQFLTSLSAANSDGTNENRTGRYVFASENTDIGTWIVERATGKPLRQQIREILLAIGGEHTILIGNDQVRLTDGLCIGGSDSLSDPIGPDGILSEFSLPVVSAGMVMTPRDFARFGTLLGSGGQAANGERVGGGPAFVQRTIDERSVPLWMDDWHYAYGAYATKWGIGHAGWGGQFVFADPKSETVVAIFSSVDGEIPVTKDYVGLLVATIIEIVEHNRKQLASDMPSQSSAD